MPAQPLPAVGAGEFVIKYKPESHHLVATLYRRASTGALVELGTERVSYALAQDTLAGEDPTVPRSDELGWEGDPDELGALGGRIKKFAKKVAKSKLGKIVKNVGKIATSFVPGASALTGTIQAAKTIKKGVQVAKKGVRVAKKLTAKPKPRPVYSDEDAAAEEMGAAAPRKAAPKPAAKKPAPKAAAKPKAAPKPAAKKPAPKATAKPKAAPKPAAKKPAPKAAAKPKAAPKPKAAAKPKAAKKPAPSAASKLAKVNAQGGAASKLLRASATAPTAAKQQQAQKLAQLVSEIEEDAPELAATLAELPETDDEDRDPVQLRAVAAAQKLAATPKGERSSVAQKIEQRLDGWKVQAPDGSIVWVPLEEVEEGGGYTMPEQTNDDADDDDYDDAAEG